MIELRVKSIKTENILRHTQGMYALMALTSLLWEDKTQMTKCKVDSNPQNGTITITTAEFIHEFTNVPLMWDESIDIHRIYADHIQELKDKEVI